MGTDAARLDELSWAAWLRSVDALPSTTRAVETGALALAAGSSERTSLLSELRKAAAVGDDGFYSYDLWECFQVAEIKFQESIAAAQRPHGVASINWARFGVSPMCALWKTKFTVWLISIRRLQRSPKAA